MRIVPAFSRDTNHTEALENYVIQGFFDLLAIHHATALEQRIRYYSCDSHGWEVCLRNIMRVVGLYFVFLK